MSKAVDAGFPAKEARVAGLLYLAIIICGIFSEVFVRGTLITTGEPAATAKNILASQSLFRLGFASDTVMVMCDVALAVLLFMLFQRVNETIALMAMIFRLVQAAVLSVNLMNHYGALLILQAGDSGSGLSTDQTASLSQFLLTYQAHGYDLGLVFFGVNCLLTGWLIWKATAIPKSLGALIGLAGLVYLAGSYLRFLAPDLQARFEPAYAVPLVAELTFCLWLLTRRSKK